MSQVPKPIEGPEGGRTEEHATVARELERASSVPQLGRVVVVEGKDAGKVFTLDQNAPSRILLGTSPACELRLTDPTVSRRHCAFEPVGPLYKVTDFGSTNGTFVNGVRILEALVSGGETVRVGSSALRLESDVVPEPPPLPSAMRFGRMLGASVAMRRLYPLCERVSRSRVPVIIEGETGTGKEALAESIHESGKGGPFVVFDCTTVSANLLESELFGHERGAFTGAVNARPGVFEEADGGTLLIDEIGDLDLQLQAKLLRVIDRGELRRVGGQKTIKVDVRVLAATRRDLDKAIALGRFRDDLFHRLAVARIELPPLRERHGDVPLLARHFAVEMGSSPAVLSAEALARLSEYSWPGNIRELRNAIARFIDLGDAEVQLGRVREGPTSTRTGSGSGDWLDSILVNPPAFALAKRKVLDEFERRYVLRILEAHDGNVAQAARASGLALRYFRLVKARQKESAE
jgi:transcriptional regulator with GAF, ATPase, and Fis domain